MLVVFDIDGTLANMEHRLPLIKTKPKQFKEFENRVHLDTVIEPIATILTTLSSFGHTIIFLSGRSESTRKATQKWLIKHDLDLYDELLLRPQGDYRADYVVKEEAAEYIKNKYKKYPDMVFEDRAQVVEMWKRKGIFVLNVAQKDE